MLPKTHMLLFTQVWRRGFHCLDGTGKNVFNTMPDRSFRPMSVNAWFNISVTCQKKWFPKKQTEDIGHKTNQLWVHLCKMLRNNLLIFHHFVVSQISKAQMFSQEVPNPGWGSKCLCSFYSAKQDVYFCIILLYIRIKNIDIVAFCYLSL